MDQDLTLEQVQKMLLDMGFTNIIVLAIPVMLFFVLLEFLAGIYTHRKVYDGRDLLASACIGLGNIAINILVKSFIFFTALYIYNLVPWKGDITVWAFVLCLLWADFWRYWAHRIAHENRFWWATHVVHHSSEQYNLSVSFRLAWTEHLKLIFFVPVMLAGFHPVVIFIVHQIEILYQFWLHTEFIKKLPPPIEYFFVTPSHHRVHHGRNEKYLDKNYGSTFIFWDRMFGTFEPETEKVDYGIITPVNSFNPVFLVFHEHWDILKDIFRSKSFNEAWRRTFVRPVKLKALEEELKQEKSDVESREKNKMNAVKQLLEQEDSTLLQTKGN